MSDVGLGSMLVERSPHRGADLTSAPVGQRGEETGGGGRLLCSPPRNTVDGPREAEGIVMEASTAALVSHVGPRFCFMMPGLPPLQSEDIV